jgi:protein-tyrosine phosphatase
MTLDFIHKSLQAGDGGVLVHCAAGVSRSATIVAAYLMVAYQIGAAEATLRVHQARPCVCPNLGFLRQLLRFERMGFQFA